MKIARVTGTVVSTIKYEKYVGMKLLRSRQHPLPKKLHLKPHS